MGAIEQLVREPVGYWSAQFDLLPWPEARLLARSADSLGFGSLWYPEAVGREAMAQGALLLEATQHAVVASGIANIFGRDPVAMRNGLRTLAEAHPDRFVLGIGVSHAPLVRRRGGDYAQPLQAMRAYLDAFEAADYRSPAPASDPVVLAALGQKMLGLAGERTAGAHTFCATVEHTQQARAALDDGLLVVAQPVIVGVSRDEAMSIAHGHLERYLALDNYRNHLRRLGWSDDAMDAPCDEELIDALIAIGDAEAAADRVMAQLDAGASHVAVLVVPATADVDTTVATLTDIRDVLIARGRWNT